VTWQHVAGAWCSAATPRRICRAAPTTTTSSYRASRPPVSPTAPGWLSSRLRLLRPAGAHGPCTRGHRRSPGRHRGLRPGAWAVDWLDGARRLSPASTLQRLESDALTRYGLAELLADPDTIEAIDTSPELGAALLRIKGTISPQLTDGLRALISRIVADIMERLQYPGRTGQRG